MYGILQTPLSSALSNTTLVNIFQQISKNIDDIRKQAANIFDEFNKTIEMIFCGITDYVNGMLCYYPGIFMRHHAVNRNIGFDIFMP